MRPPVIPLALALSALSALFTPLVTAQTFTDCNPMQNTCPGNPALSGTYTWTYGGEAPNFRYISGKDVIKYGGPDGAIFRVEKSKDAPTIVSNFYIMWGKYEVVLKAAPGAGIVSSIVLQSDDLDEIDWEWLGGKPGEAQSNYFGKGNTATYDRGGVHPVDSQARFHKYGVEWTAEKIDWSIDGTVVRTLRPSQVQGDFYPQTPMTARIGVWAGGDPGNSRGTIEWAGGPTDYTKGPFDMVIKSIYVQDYSTGTEYRYRDRSGSASSIESVGGTIYSGGAPPSGNSPGNSSPSGSGTGGPPASFNAPSNSGRVSSSTTKSEPTTTQGQGSVTTNNPEATQTSPSSPSPFSPVDTPGSVNLVTGDNRTSPSFAPTVTGNPSSGGSRNGVYATTTLMVAAAAGLIYGWLL